MRPSRSSYPGFGREQERKVFEVSGEHGLSEALLKLTRRRSGEGDLNDDANQVQESEGCSEEFDAARGSEDEEECSYEEGRCEVDNAIGYPSDHVQDGMSGPCEDVGDVCAIPDRLESRQYGNPNMRPG